MCFKHNESVDISENWFLHTSICRKWLTSATSCAFSIQHACGLSTIPTLLDVQMLLRMLELSEGKGCQIITTAPRWSVAILRYSGYRARGVCGL